MDELRGDSRDGAEMDLAHLSGRIESLQDRIKKLVEMAGGIQQFLAKASEPWTEGIPEVDDGNFTLLDLDLQANTNDFIEHWDRDIAAVSRFSRPQSPTSPVAWDIPVAKEEVSVEYAGADQGAVPQHMAGEVDVDEAEPAPWQEPSASDLNVDYAADDQDYEPSVLELPLDEAADEDSLVNAKELDAEELNVEQVSAAEIEEAHSAREQVQQETVKETGTTTQQSHLESAKSTGKVGQGPQQDTVKDAAAAKQEGHQEAVKYAAPPRQGTQMQALQSKAADGGQDIKADSIQRSPGEDGVPEKEPERAKTDVPKDRVKGAAQHTDENAQTKTQATATLTERAETGKPVVKQVTESVEKGRPEISQSRQTFEPLKKAAGPYLKKEHSQPASVDNSSKSSGTLQWGKFPPPMGRRRR